MTTLEFMALYNQRPLREYVSRTAHLKSASFEDAEDYIQDAWIAISQADPQKTHEFYCLVAYKAIHRDCQRDSKRRGRETVADIKPWDVAGEPRSTWYRKKVRRETKRASKC